MFIAMNTYKNTADTYAFYTYIKSNNNKEAKREEEKNASTLLIAHELMRALTQPAHLLIHQTH